MKNDPVYQILEQVAAQQLTENRKFFRKDVLAASPFATFNITVEWGRVRETLEHKLGVKLTPIAARDEDGEWDPDIHPEKFLPGAYRPTIGYAMPAEMARVSMSWAERRSKVVIGAARSLDVMVASYQKAGLPITYKPAVLPVLELPPAEAAE